MVVIVEGDATRWSAELRRAIAGELHAEAIAPGDTNAKVARGTLVLSLSASSSELVVRYRPAQGSELVRRVQAPHEQARIIRTTALLAGNLVRNEAREILDSQKARETSPAIDRAAPSTGAASSSAPDAGVPDPNAAPTAPTPTAPATEPGASPNDSAGKAAPSGAPPSSGGQARTESGRAEAKPIERPCLKLQAAAPLHPVVVSLVHPIATNFGQPRVRTPLALNFPFGRVGQVEGADLGVISRVGCDVDGAQIQMGYAHAGGQVHGVQIGGFGAVTREKLIGLQASFIVDKATNVEGAQIGLVTLSHETKGAQGGLVNVAGTLYGGQFGLTNVAGDVTGIQVGLVNVGRRIKGAQFGLVNIAEDVEGASVGLITLSKTGYIRPVAWVGSSTYLNANVGLRFDMRWMYGQVSVGYVDGSGFDDVALATSLGLHVFRPDVPGFLLDFELGNQSRFGKDGEDDKSRGMVHALAGWRLAPRLAFFAGMGIVYAQRSNDSFIGPDVLAGALF